MSKVRVAPVERLRGMHDVPPARFAVREATAARILAALARAGYERVDVPVIEPTELFLRQTGEERVGQMYAFRYHNRELALRPEFTASVVRAAIADNTPLPARLSYCGPVFRYDQLVGTRARQFTEIGAELLGANGAAADAEAIGLAYDALRVAGVAEPRLVIGHVGVARGYLAGLRLDERVRDWLVWSMERLRPDDADGERVHPALAALLAEESTLPAPAMTVAPDRDTFLALLREAGIALDGGNRRSAEEIAEGLMRKIARRDERSDVRRALAFLRRLVTLRGKPDDVLPQLETLLADEGLGSDGAQRLRDVLAILPAYGVPPDAITLDMGLGRGLTYYTGIVFQVYADNAPEQLGGGGRYDDLAGVLGAAEPWPAVGFSLGLEAVLAHAEPQAPTQAAPMFIVKANDDEQTAIRVAVRMRLFGWTVLLDSGSVHDVALNAVPVTIAHGMVQWTVPGGTPNAVALDVFLRPITDPAYKGYQSV